MTAVVLPTLLTLLVLTGIVGAVLYFSTTETDAIAATKQTQRVRIAVSEGIKAVRVDQEASTYWDDAVVRTRQRPLDARWIDNNLGIWFHTYYGIDETYLLDPSNQPVYAMRDGRRARPSEFARVATPALLLTARLRQRLSVSRLLPDGSKEKTVGAFGVTVVAGRPALLSVKPLISETGEIAQPSGSEYVHVAVRYLDGSFLDQIANRYLVDRPVFRWTALPGPSVAIQDFDGAKRGYISWTPFQPGKNVAREMLPALVIALLIIGALVSLLLWRIKRTREECEASRNHAQIMAFHDGLTGLPNRALFEDRLGIALGRRDIRTAVLLLDLDRFKNVNDTLGHQAGDALIRQFGDRLTKLIRQGDTVARLGGDEFAVLVEGAALENVRKLAHRILEEVRRPFPVAGAQAFVGVSIGVALSNESCRDPHELVRQADIALYSAKESGRDTYRLFTREMDKHVKLRSTVEVELRSAIATGTGLCLHYQPEVLGDGRMVGVEALLRWEHPQRGLMLPSRFITVAEETGLIVALGEWVLRQACLASLHWPGLYVAVNLSPVQFRAPRFLDRLIEIVSETGADPGQIELEVTERVLLQDNEGVRAILAKLHAAGFKIVLDDFGTGYSSLSYLRKFEIDKIKIDASFVRHLGDESDSAAIVTAVLALGQAMGLTVAAEGVETADQVKFLKIAGCTEMQGHYFSSAVPAKDVTSLLNKGPSASVEAA
jgi:diguanylate cyclase (GGDEF)-like protein